jgi:cytochrome oxidase Cu insertion factor (SCO1/SenC/PrrC family)
MNSPENDGPEAKTPFWKNPWVIGAVSGILFLTVLRVTQDFRKSAPPPLFSPDAWELVDQSGHAFGSEHLKGKVWIAAFFFTRCPSVCPALMKKMKEVHQRFEGDEAKIHFVSFTVDPEFDQPRIMKKYREERGMDAANWSFVTGDPKKVHEVLVGTLKQGIGPKTPIGGAPARAPDKGADQDEQKAGDHAGMDHAGMDHAGMDHAGMDHAGMDPAKDASPQAAQKKLPPKESEALFDISHQARFALFDQNGDLRGLFATEELIDLAHLVASAKLFVEQGPNP